MAKNREQIQPVGAGVGGRKRIFAHDKSLTVRLQISLVFAAQTCIYNSTWGQSPATASGLPLEICN